MRGLETVRDAPHVGAPRAVLSGLNAPWYGIDADQLGWFGQPGTGKIDHDLIRKNQVYRLTCALKTVREEHARNQGVIFRAHGCSWDRLLAGGMSFLSPLKKTDLVDAAVDCFLLIVFLP